MTMAPALLIHSAARQSGRRTAAAVLVLPTAMLAAAITVAIAVLPSLHFAYRNPDLHVALLTAEALVAMLTAYLVFGRLDRRRRLDDLVLCAAFAVMAASNLLFAALPAI